MTRDEKFKLHRRTSMREMLNSIGVISGFALKTALLIVYITGAVYVQSKQEAANAFVNDLLISIPLVEAFYNNLLLSYLLVGGVVVVILWLYPFERKMVEDQFQSVGLANAAGLVPKLIRKRRDKDKPRVSIWEFNNPSIPLKTWEDKQASIEAALDINIISMKYGTSKSRIIILSVPAKDSLPDYIEWKNEYLSTDNFVLVLGEGYTGPITVNLAKIPHILLGGSTGSGKSVLLKLLLMQSLRRGAEVYIADFKGGVDFHPAWHKQCHMCFMEDDLIELLTGLVDELECRKILFKEAGSPNLDEYNKRTGEALQRHIFACDEVAEILDKTGLKKEQKEKVNLIEIKLSVIARQGRAFGIHLILATQRPDANILSGQIRNNMDCRVCGRADNVLSQIILDSTAASEQIPKDATGRFLLYDGTLFQAFWFDDTKLERS